MQFLAVPRVFTRLVQTCRCQPDVYRRQAPMRTAELTCISRAKSCRAIGNALMYALCKQHRQTDSKHMQPCMVSIAISMCMFFPYSKNAAAEFVSKINLATVHPCTWWCTHSYSVCTHVRHSTKQLQWQSARHCNACYVGCVHLGGSIIPPSVHQMHTNVLLCHLGVSPLNHLQNKPNHFLD
jgi:hypothetical protein